MKSRSYTTQTLLMFNCTSPGQQRLFEKLDQNGDGLVSLDELEWVLHRIGVQTSPDELASLVGKKSLDRLDFVLFYDTVMKQNVGNQSEATEERPDGDLECDLAKAFEVYDLNGDGFISSEELQTVLSQIGLWNENAGRDCKGMIKTYDTNSDGLLDFQEFKNMMRLNK